MHEGFSGKVVVDIGCGYGDLLLKSAEHGASKCIAIDKDTSVARSKLYGANVYEVEMDIDRYPLTPFLNESDIAFCTSVLPYLKNYDRILGEMAGSGVICFIECQYAGDGPGFDQIKDDADMKEFLLRYFKSADIIGRTEVKDGKYQRTIWRCKDAC